MAFDVRLLAVADQFEALTADRPYREGLAPEAAELVAAGHAFDPDIPVPGRG